MTVEEAQSLIAEVQRTRTEREDLEIKSAHDGTPTRALRESISAFANRTGGGIIVLGIEEAAEFAVVGVHNTQRLLTDLANIAATDFVPPVRIETTIADYEGKPVIIVEVPETLIVAKPCYIAARGIQAGSYVRTGPSNRQMTTYEILSYLDYRERRTFDDQLVKRATVADLDENRIRQFVLRIQEQSNRNYSDLSYEDQVIRFGIGAMSQEGIVPTIAGLLCFGTYPQQFHPQLRIVFVQYFGREVGTLTPTGGRFLDNREFDGPVGEMINSVLSAVIQASPIATIVDGVQHRDLPRYPVDALREAIVNAVVHRDYSPMALGSHIQIALFSDRLEIKSPGSLYGGMTFSTLHNQQSTRNPLLMRFMEDMGMVENRGTGIDTMIRSTIEANLPAPEFSVSGSWWFQVTFRHESPPLHERAKAIPPGVGHPTREQSELRVLELFDSFGQITNTIVQEHLGIERHTALRTLQRLVAKGMLTRHGERRGAYYTRA
jgi:ATP-dependent DNA helicase RecG